MTWVWIGVFVAVCVIPMVAWVWFTEIRHSGPDDE
jgi:hypothetical protein